jgi:RNA polymerase sigma factor (sigma-70 family)
MASKDLYALVNELRAGRNHLLVEIFKENASYCINTLRKKYQCPREDAKDIYADAILNFRAKVISGEVKFLTDAKSYLFATCKNMLLARYKKERRFQNVLSDFKYLASESDDGDDTSYYESLHTLTEEAFSSIPDKCRDLLRYFYYDQLSMGEIALRLNFRNENVAKVSKTRCLQRLLELVKGLQESKVSQ